MGKQAARAGAYRQASVVAILLLGVVASLGVFWTMRVREREAKHEELRLRAVERAELLRSKVARAATVLHGMRGFFGQEILPSREAFRRYVREQLAVQPEMQALEWIPRVTHGERAAFESRAQMEGYRNFQFTEHDATGQLTRDRVRDEYYPVYYVEPLEGNSAALGFNLASSEARRLALDLAREHDRLTATPPLRLAQETENQYGMLVMLPVRSEAGLDAADQRSALIGYALAVFRSGDLIKSTLASLHEHGFDASVRDVASGTELYAASASQENLPPRWLRPLYPLVTGLAETISIDVAGRRWDVEIKATPAFAAGELAWRSWSAFLTCILLTTSLGMYLFRASARQAVIEHHVRRRTAQLVKEVRQRERAESVARLAEAKYRSIFENSIEGIFQTTAEGRYLAANRSLALMYGFETPEALILALSDIEHELYVDPRRRQEFVRCIQEQGELRDFESQVRRRDGRIIWISENARAVRSADGKLLYYEGNVIDVTMRRQAEETLRRAHDELEVRVQQRTAELAAANSALQDEIKVRVQAEAAADSANRAKTTFLTNMSHEIRTPMNAIIGYSQVLVRGPDLTRQQRHALETILTASNHLMEIINEILDLAKIESGREELDVRAFDLTALAVDIGMMFQQRAAQKQLSLVLETPGQPRWVAGDNRKIRQVLINLVGNAEKFTTYGHVRIAVIDEANDLYRFEVSDTGPGIAEKDLENIFTAFAQSDAGHLHGGTGLGLAIARAQVSLMKSQLHVTSEVGRGSTFGFVLELPAAQELAPVVTEVVSEVELQPVVAAPCGDDLVPVTVSAELQEKLRDAASTCATTRLRRLSEELAAVSPAAGRLAACIQEHTRRFDYAEVARLIEAYVTSTAGQPVEALGVAS